MQGLSVSTNATLLTPELSRGLLASPLTWIGISLDGALPETYAQMRTGGSLEDVMARVRGLLELNATQPREFPTLGLQIIATNRTRPELEQFAAQWQPYLERTSNVRLEIKPYTDWAGQVECHDLRAPERRAGFFYTACSYPQSTLTISADGQVLRCCHEVDAHLDLGEVNSHTLAEVWHGPGLQALRRRMARGAIGDLDLCGQCELARKYPADYLRRRRRPRQG
jgi:radical SAM protein with 4Fe4S-binding SPASM domain